MSFWLCGVLGDADEAAHRGPGCPEGRLLQDLGPGGTGRPGGQDRGRQMRRQGQRGAHRHRRVLPPPLDR